MYCDKCAAAAILYAVSRLLAARQMQEYNNVLPEEQID